MAIYSPDSQCVRKVSFPSKKAAKGGARRRESSGCGLLTPYKCPHCGWWHVGHDRANEPRRPLT